MIKRFRQSLHSTAIHILCILALVLIGFSHKPPVTFQSSLSGIDLSQFSVPDGGVPVFICSSTNNNKTGKPVINQDCPVCRLFASVVLSDPAPVPFIKTTWSRAPYRPAQDHTVATKPSFYNVSPRSPPYAIG